MPPRRPQASPPPPPGWRANFFPHPCDRPNGVLGGQQLMQSVALPARCRASQPASEPAKEGLAGEGAAAALLPAAQGRPGQARRAPAPPHPSVFQQPSNPTQPNRDQVFPLPLFLFAPHSFASLPVCCVLTLLVHCTGFCNQPPPPAAAQRATLHSRHGQPTKQPTSAAGRPPLPAAVHRHHTVA